MNILDIIAKKRDGEVLDKNEIDFFVNEYVAENITDYQAAAMLMAMYIRGLDAKETAYLTMAMAYSSNVLDFSGVFKNDYILDKHSTGGVGDKVTIIAVPIAAALGAKIFKMSGRGLGFTGGTADKLESIEGYKVEQDLISSMRVVNSCGACMVSQSSELAVADKKLYALRDVTSTVNSIPLIASSIMSKKIACGVNKIVLEVTVGNGAFAKTEEEAIELAKTMVKIGKDTKKEVIAIITNMYEPLGLKVGNALELEEVIDFLTADKEDLESDKWSDLKDIVYEVVAYMIKLSGKGDVIRENRKMIEEAILDRRAYSKFLDIVKAQGGQIEGRRPVLKNQVKFKKEIKALEEGFVNYVRTDMLGAALVELGGGRHKKEDTVDPAVGFVLHKKNGDKVYKGDTILEVYFNDKAKFDNAAPYISKAIAIESERMEDKPCVLGIITEEDI